MESAGFVNKLKGNRPSMPTIWTEEDKLASAKKLSQVQLIQFEEVDVPLLPTTKFTHYQQYFREIMAWFSFRNSYYAKHMEQIYK